MTDLPYTYKDSGGSELRIGRGYCTASDRTNHKTVSVNAPTGEDAAEFARAVLSAAGDTGHRVVHEADLIGAENAVVAMRQRAAYLVEYSPDMSRADLVEAIRALPLIPDTDGTTDTQHAQLPDRNGDVIDDIAIALTRRDDLSDEHRAFYSEVLDRFDVLASELARVRDDRDRHRTAWESARRGRAQAYRQLDVARRWVRILEAQRKDLRREVRAESARVSQARDERDQALQAAREVTGRLPDDEGPVEPQDEAPRDTELTQQVCALVKRYGAPWVAYEAARQARP